MRCKNELKDIDIQLTTSTCIESYCAHLIFPELNELK